MFEAAAFSADSHTCTLASSSSQIYLSRHTLAPFSPPSPSPCFCSHGPETVVMPPPDEDSHVLHVQVHPTACKIVRNDVRFPSTTAVNCEAILRIRLLHPLPRPSILPGCRRPSGDNPKDNLPALFGARSRCAPVNWMALRSSIFVLFPHFDGLVGFSGDETSASLVETATEDASL